MSQGEFDAALYQLEYLSFEGGLEADELIAGKLLQSQILTNKGDYEEGLRIAKEVLVESQEQGKLLSEIDACIAIADSFEQRGMPDESLRIIKQVEALIAGLRRVFGSNYPTKGLISNRPTQALFLYASTYLFLAHHVDLEVQNP